MRIGMKGFKLETHSKLVSNEVCFGEPLGATATTAALCTVMFHFLIVTRL
jgi:hypothetical protein